MSTIRSSVGLVSGIDSQQIINALLAVQQQQVASFKNRIKGFQAEQGGYQSLEANLAPILTASQTLSQAATFQAFQVKSSDDKQLAVTAGSTAATGSYTFQALRQSSSHIILSKGFVNSDKQTLGAGKIVIANGGGLNP